MKEPWRCAVCGVDRETADRRRARKRQPRTSSRAVTCSARCSDIRHERVRVAMLRGARDKIPPLHRGRRGEWVCSQCGVGLEEAARKRRALGLTGVARIGQRFCTPACRKAFVARLNRWVWERRAKRSGRRRSTLD